MMTVENTLPCKSCSGLCCGPVPVTKDELALIRQEIKKWPEIYRLELEHQQRYIGTCVFYDLNNNKCGIHHFRPAVCRAYGHYKNLACFKKPTAASNENWAAAEDPAGILSADFTWKDFR